MMDKQVSLGIEALAAQPTAAGCAGVAA